MEAADAPLPLVGASVADEAYTETEVGADDDGEDGEEEGEGDEEGEGEYEEYEEYDDDDGGVADGPDEGSEEVANEATEEPEKKKVEVATIVPTRGAFFLHDDRCDGGGGRRYPPICIRQLMLCDVRQALLAWRRRHQPRKKVWEATNDEGEWKHDKFHELTLEDEMRPVRHRS